MLKFDFSVLTRDGQKVESVLIAGVNQQDAERKLTQMYRYCEVIRCEVKQETERQSGQAVSVEEILSLMAKQTVQ